MKKPEVKNLVTLFFYHDKIFFGYDLYRQLKIEQIFARAYSRYTVMDRLVMDRLFSSAMLPCCHTVLWWSVFKNMERRNARQFEKLIICCNDRGAGYLSDLQ